MNLESISTIFEDPLVKKLTNLAILLVVLFLVAAWLRRIVAKRIGNADVRYRVRKSMGAATWVIAGLFVASTFSDRLGGLAVTFGVAGAGIAFALQEVIASVAGRVAILFGGFYDVGDRVQVGGIKGDVIDIGVLRTTVMEIGDWVKGDLYTGRVVRVANSFVFKEPVFNYSGDFSFLWDEIIVPVKYGSDRALTRRVLEEVAEAETSEFVETSKQAWQRMTSKYRIEEMRVEPLVTLVANDNWLEYTIRYVVPYTRRRTTKNALFERLMDAVDATNGKVALASATFHLVETPVVDVRILPGEAGAPKAEAS